MGFVTTGRRPCRIVVDRLLIDQTFVLPLIRHLHPARGLVTPLKDLANLLHRPVESTADFCHSPGAALDRSCQS
jgi:hypothetical protein